MSDRTELTGSPPSDDALDRGETECPPLSPLSDLDVGEIWTMVEASPDGMILTDERGIIMVVNGRIEALFGYDRGDLLGRMVETLVPERHRQVHAALRRTYRAEPFVRAMGTGLDLMARRSDGSEFPVEVSLSPVTAGGGLRVVATVRDITDRVAIEAHAHAVSHTIDAVRDGVFIFTADTLEFQYVNRGAIAQLGYAHDELLTMTPLHIKPEFTETTFRELLAPLLDQQVSSHTFTTTHRRKDGKDIPVEILIEYPSAAGPGQPRLLVAIVRDITERLAGAQAVLDREATQRILEDRERLARDLHDMVIQRLFAAGMALQSIHTLIDHDDASRCVEQTVTELDETIHELRAAIFQLTTPRMASVDVALVDVVRRAADRLGFEPSVRMDGNLENLSLTTVESLVPVLTEILSNVARHAQATSVDIHLDIGVDQISLTVSDNGIGINGAKPRGNGMTNLIERARKHGGDATFSANSTGIGTLVSWTAAI